MNQFLENNQHIPGQVKAYLFHHDFACALDQAGCAAGHVGWIMAWAGLAFGFMVLSLWTQA
jgi:hypothetical protein